MLEVKALVNIYMYTFYIAGTCDGNMKLIIMRSNIRMTST